MKGKKTTKSNRFLKLKYYREMYGYSQIDFADLLRKTVSSYSHKETRRTPFDYNEMILIYQELNRAAKKAGDAPITLDDIFLI